MSKKRKTSDESKKDLDDVKLVMHSLRHHCDRVRQLENAVPIIVKKAVFQKIG